MTESQYARANRKVYPVVLLQLIIMTGVTILKLILGITIPNITMIVVAIFGIFILGYVMKAELEGKMRAIGLLGTAAVIYFIFMLLSDTATVYAYALPLMAASTIYLNSITLTAFNEENLQVQKEAYDKMVLVADNLVKHFDEVKDALDTLSEVIQSNNESMSNITDGTGSSAEAIQEQAMMCTEIQSNTDVAERDCQYA